MALWPEVALEQMRRSGSFAYMDSYAANDDKVWGRNRRDTNTGAEQSSSQATRANLTMGRYASPTAFTTTNPDYAAELSYFGSTDPIRTQTWGRLLQWNHIYMSTAYKDNHTPGFINNTRVMVFGAELWIKSKATGIWSRVAQTDSHIGEWWSPDFVVYNGSKESTGSAYRIESSTGYASIRPVRAAHNSPRIFDQDANYWLWHGYSGMTAIDGPDVADVISISKVSLVLNDPTQADDRDASRYLYAIGADYYPPDTRLTSYPGVGTSRHKFIRAKWPNWQWAVMHTMTEAQFNATNGYPAALANLAEGTSTVTPPTGGGGGVTPPTVNPSRGRWFTKTVSTKNAWNSSQVTNTAPTKVRRTGRSKIR